MIKKGDTVIMKKVIIIYDRYLDLEGNYLTIGGIQTYIKNLCQVILKLGMKPYIVQESTNGFVKKMDNIIICGVINKRGKLRKRLVRYSERMANVEEDILIFASYILYAESKFKNTINIQHGISWDIPIDKHGVEKFGQLYRRFNQIYGVMAKVNKTKYTICVDYNFINWYRTQVMEIRNNMLVIPNFSEIPDYIEKKNECVKIIFARRLWYYRGTRLFANAVIRMLGRYDIEITIAGEGPDEEWLKNKLRDYKQVKFIKYNSEDSLCIHEKYDIAVVPTLGSEGTSLSLLEAMASSCAVIATNVGGMTNVIIDGYNGLLINPNEEELVRAIERLVNDENFRERISRKGYQTVSEGFSRVDWEKRWSTILVGI